MSILSDNVGLEVVLHCLIKLVRIRLQPRSHLRMKIKIKGLGIQVPQQEITTLVMFIQMQGCLKLPMKLFVSSLQFHPARQLTACIPHNLQLPQVPLSTSLCVLGRLGIQDLFRRGYFSKPWDRGYTKLACPTKRFL